MTDETKPKPSEAEKLEGIQFRSADYRRRGRHVERRMLRFERRKHVAMQAAEGKSVKEIAEALTTPQRRVSERTVYRDLSFLSAYHLRQAHAATQDRFLSVAAELEVMRAEMREAWHKSKEGELTEVEGSSSGDSGGPYWERRLRRSPGDKGYADTWLKMTEKALDLIQLSVDRDTLRDLRSAPMTFLQIEDREELDEFDAFMHWKEAREKLQRTQFGAGDDEEEEEEDAEN